MRAVSRTLVILGFLVGSAICAMASPAGTEVTWTFNDVVFQFGGPGGPENTVTGYFETDLTGTTVLRYSILVSGAWSPGAFTASIFFDSYLPNTIGFANSDFSQYVALYLTTPLTGAGGVIPIASGFDCANGPCAVLLLAADGHNPEIVGVVVPERSALLNLDVVCSFGLVGFVMMRRKIIQA